MVQFRSVLLSTLPGKKKVDACDLPERRPSRPTAGEQSGEENKHEGPQSCDHLKKNKQTDRRTIDNREAKVKLVPTCAGTLALKEVEQGAQTVDRGV